MLNMGGRGECVAHCSLKRKKGEGVTLSFKRSKKERRIIRGERLVIGCWGRESFLFNCDERDSFKFLLVRKMLNL